MIGELLRPVSQFHRQIRPSIIYHNGCDILVNGRYWWSKLVGHQTTDFAQNVSKFNAHKWTMQWHWNMRGYKGPPWGNWSEYIDRNSPKLLQLYQHQPHSYNMYLDWLSVSTQAHASSFAICDILSHGFISYHSWQYGQAWNNSWPTWNNSKLTPYIIHKWNNSTVSSQQFWAASNGIKQGAAVCAASIYCHD